MCGDDIVVFVFTGVGNNAGLDAVEVGERFGERVVPTAAALEGFGEGDGSVFLGLGEDGGVARGGGGGGDGGAGFIADSGEGVEVPDGALGYHCLLELISQIVREGGTGGERRKERAY